MARTDTQSDPKVERELYGDLGPGFADAQPIWSDTSFPDSWFGQPDAQLAIAPGVAPPGAAPGLPPTAASGPQPALPDVNASDAGPPTDASAAVPADAGAPAEGPPPDAAGGGPPPPMHPADLAALGVAPPTFGPSPPPPGFIPPPATVAGMPDITIQQEAPGASAGIGAPPAAPPGAPVAVLPSEIPPPAQIAAAPLPPGAVGPVTPAEQHYRNTLQQYAGHIDQIPDPVERQRAYDDLYTRGTRGEQAAYEAREAEAIKAHTDRVEAQRAQILREHQEANQKAFEDWRQTQKDTEAKMADAQAAAERIANTKIDPSDALNPIQKVAGVIMGLVGGLYQGRMGMSNNIGLDALNTIVNRNIAEQKANLERQLQGAQGKMTVLGQEYARHGDMYRAEQVVRMASYQAADQLLAIEQQNYTPGGTTERRIAAYRAGAVAQAQMAAIDLKGKMDKQSIELRDQNRKEQDTLSQMAERRANAARAYAGADRDRAEARKLGAEADELNPAHFTNPDYTVPIGQNDPFSGQPIYGKYRIGGKDREKDEAAVRNSINSYGAAQDWWAKLAAIAKRIEGHKSLGEQAWSKLKDTDAADYDQATHALTVALTKELGDKLTQGQLDEQGKRIPQRADWFEKRNVEKLIASAQEDSDRDFIRDMRQSGVNYAPIVAGAQQRRRMMEPTPESDVDNARAAIANNPNDKNAQRALANAQERLQAGVEAAQRRRLDVTAARQAPPGPATLPEYDVAADFGAANLGVGDLNPKSAYGKQELAHETQINTAIQEANRAAAHYEALRDKFREADSNEHLRGLTMPGDVAVANRAHDVELGTAASQLLAAQKLAAETQAKAQQLLREKQAQRWNERRVFATPDEYLAKPDLTNPFAPPNPLAERGLGDGHLELPGVPPPQVLKYWNRHLDHPTPLENR